MNSKDGIHNVSDTTVAGRLSQASIMAPEQRAASPFSRQVLPPEISIHVKTIKRAFLAWTDDFDRLVAASLTTARLQKKQDKAEDYRDNLTDALLEVKALATDPSDIAWLADIEATTKTLRKNYSEFIAAADAVLGVREQLVDEPAYAYFSVKDAKEKCTALTEDVKALVEDAADAGLVDKATDLDAKIRELSAAQMESVTKLANQSEVFGIIGTTGNRVIDVPVPTFSGNPADTDFFTSSANWTRYCGVREHQEKSKDKAAAACIAVKKARVEAYSHMIDKQMNELITVFRTLDSAKLADEPVYAYHIESAKDAKEKCTALTEDAKALVEDAADAGLVDKATDLDAKIRELNATQMESVTQMANNKEVFGIIGTTGNRVIDVPVPTFSGNAADTNFFTSANWPRYCGSKVMSEPEKFSVLSQTFLTDQAKNISSMCKTVAKVPALLRKYYGNPWYLLNTSMGELRKIGGSSGASVHRREWDPGGRKSVEQSNPLLAASCDPETAVKCPTSS